MKVRDLMRTVESDGWSRKNEGESPLIQASKQAGASHDIWTSRGRRSSRYAEEHTESSWLKRKTVKRYAVVIESGPNNLSAYVPDLPGCITTGRTLEEIEQNIREAIELHFEGMMEDGEPIPEPKTSVSYVELQVA
jgi:predicted RNase H-like HicB family nuclease